MRQGIRLAFAGRTAWASPWLLRAVGQCPAQFVGICDETPERAEQSAAMFHARWWFDDVGAMLRDTQPQGVVVAGPAALRAEIAARCAADGIPILVVGNPPAAGRGSRAASLVSAGTAGRFSPAGVLAGRVLRSGRLGELLALTVRHAAQRREEETPLCGVGGDALFEAADWIEWMVGPCRDVAARGHPDGAVAAVLVGQAETPVSLSVVQTASRRGPETTIEVRGAEGWLRLDRSMRLRASAQGRSIARHAPQAGQADPAVELGFVGWVSEFVRRIGGAESELGAWTGPARLAAVIAAAVGRKRGEKVRG